MALIAYAVLGLAYGATLQRSGFCFARAALEVFILRERDSLRGVLAGLLAGTLGFAMVAALRPSAPANSLILPFGAGTVIGAALFGLGMTIAGMCVVGTLVRLGEGYALAWFTLAGLVLGARYDPLRRFLPGALKTPAPGRSLAEFLGPDGAVVATVLALLLLWAVAAGRPGGAKGFRLRALLAGPVLGGLILAALNTVQVSLLEPWTVAYPLSLAASPSPTRAAVMRALPLIVLDGALVAGALLSSLAGRSLRFRWPRDPRQLALAAAGGVLMGWGVQLARGCNIGGLFSAVPSLSLSAWLFLPGLALGAWLGARLLTRLA